MTTARLRDWLLVVLGVWQMMAPKVLHFSSVHTDAIWNAWLVGAALILMISVRRYLLDFRSPWEDLTEALLGIWLMVSPFILGFAGYIPARTNSLIVGAIMTVVALSAAFVDSELRKKPAGIVPQPSLPR